MQDRTESSLSKDRIERLAPDQASLSAALRLTNPVHWPVLAAAEGHSLIWGECQGSGSAPYRVVVSTDDLAFKCICPSRKLPCKHTLALMLIAVREPEMLAKAEPPDWMLDWRGRRRPKAQSLPIIAGPNPSPPAGASLAVAAAAIDLAPRREADPKVAVRAEAQRQRLRDEREAAVIAGLDELERWIADQIGVGLAGFAKRAGEGIRALSTRLVDRKAGGLASRLDLLAVDLLRVPDAERQDLVIERLAELVVISSAYRNQDRLPTPLREDVRRAVGWSAKREDLLTEPNLLRANSTWIVVGTRSEVQPNALRRLETWLLDGTARDGEARFALLVDYMPASAGPASSPFTAGEVIAGEVVYYPSATALRAVLATRAAGDAEHDWPALPQGLAYGLAAFDTALARKPWLDAWPLAGAGVSVVPLSSGGLGLADAEGIVVPLDGRQTDVVLPLLGLDAMSVVAIWDGRRAIMLAADTAIGRWYGE